jgi:aspartyl-tRNA(Asn)/glutamyl-tRNA(Gln) amidotransferase subunit A
VTADLLSQAFVSYDATAHGEGDGPLSGVAVAVKDNLAVAGTRTSCGSALLADSPLELEDAEAVRRLRAAGARIVGKTTLHEFAYGATGVNSYQGTPVNPWRAGYTPGGSSSGSAVAVAAGVVPLALGTDAAGSIRMPASLCGVVGLKPTHGRVSSRGLRASHNPTVDHVGPLTRTVADAALALQVLAGYDPLDPTSIDAPVPDYSAALGRADLHGVRIGVAERYFFDVLDPQVESGVRQALDQLRQLGACLVPVMIANLEEMMPARLALFAEGLAFHTPRLRAHPELYTDEIRQRLYVDHFVQAHDHARANRVRTLLRERFAHTFRDARLDVLVAPTTPIPAVPVEQAMVRLPDKRTGGETFEPVGLLLLRLTAPCNLSGMPAISIPAGFTADGLPFGLQLMGRPFDEGPLLGVADVYDRANGWGNRRPG